MKEFWKKYYIPLQTNFLEEFEDINPAEAYRRQAEVINMSGPIYAEIESLEARLHRVSKVENEIRTQILAQNLNNMKSTFRNSELIEAFILESAAQFYMPNGELRDVSVELIRMSRRRKNLEFKIKKLQKRIQALEAMADKCDKILNWAKHQARLEMTLIG